MKRIIVSLFVFVVLASHLHAQAGSTRRPVNGKIPIATGATVPDTADPWETMRTNPESYPAPPRPHAANPVPVSQLRVPHKAVKEFERSQKAIQGGDVRASVDHLQKALQIYPDFIQAHNALGLLFVQLHEYEKALTEHQTALSLDPRSARTLQNLSFVLLLLNRNQEAEAEARQALDLDSQLVASRYVLGRAIVGQGHVTPEGMEMLRQSENAFPNASLVLAQIYFTTGQTDQVIAELRHYLSAPSDSDNKRKAECWIAQLSQQPSPAGCPVEPARPSFR
jgi:cytochrome c-type biogenesis protein CcmH/NrfG